MMLKEQMKQNIILDIFKKEEKKRQNINKYNAKKIIYIKTNDLRPAIQKSLCILIVCQ